MMKRFNYVHYVVALRIKLQQTGSTRIFSHNFIHKQQATIYTKMSPLLKRIAYGEHMSEIIVRINYSSYPRILSAIALDITRAARAHIVWLRVFFLLLIHSALEIRPIYLAYSSIWLLDGCIISLSMCNV